MWKATKYIAKTAGALYIIFDNLQKKNIVKKER
ncbi:hypothetical protein RUMTOR_01772 [[Ruminococcus] torques ATCC 27756]|uniref:Uncharacterized protein n=1 Tax=[Ruminococcus] torques ATCC 27756 TaxID=411460 RepID=A5KNE7_9FIRM|nr:hypothetical protein RUMTOR_01772 [[Ruminococcus] torques ATCC 27756]